MGFGVGIVRIIISGILLSELSRTLCELRKQKRTIFHRRSWKAVGLYSIVNIIRNMLILRSFQERLEEK
jgi:hypothetical protein